MLCRRQADSRQFAITMTPAPTANLELSAKLVTAGGKIAGSRDFKQSVPLATVDAPGAVAALDGAFGKVLADAVPWIAELPVEEAPAKDAKSKDGDADIPEPEMPEPPPAP